MVGRSLMWGRASRYPRTLLIATVALLTIVAASIVIYIATRPPKPSEWDYMQQELQSARFSPDHNVIATRFNFFEVGLWDPANKKLIDNLGEGSPFYTQMAFAPDGNRFVWSDYSYVLIYDMRLGGLTGTPIKAPNTIYSLAISPATNEISETDILAVGSSTLELWNMVLGDQAIAGDQSHYVVADHLGDDRVYSLAFSDDGSLLAAGLAEGHVRVWEISTNKTHDSYQTKQVFTDTVSSNEVTQIAISPDKQMLAVGDYQGGANVVSLQNGRTLSQLSEPYRLQASDNLELEGLTFSPDSRLLAGVYAFDSRPSFVVVWNSSTGEQVLASPEEAHVIVDTRFSSGPNGEQLAVSYADGTEKDYQLP